MRRPRYSLGVVCSIGLGPTRGGRVKNEDNYLIWRAVWREGDAERMAVVPPNPTVLLAVADGMGGHEDGDVASASAVQAIARLYQVPAPGDPETALREYLLDAHRRLHARAALNGKVRMGTTLTVVWLVGERVYWSHVGDSRLYLWRRGQLSRLTRDHTRAEFARRDNRQAPTHPNNLSQNFIYGSRGLGDDRAVRIDPGLDTGSFPIFEGDRVVLCTDGVTMRVEDGLIGDVVGNVPDPSACAMALMERAIASGADDNVTAIVLRCDGVGPAPVDDEDTDDDRTLVPID